MQGNAVREWNEAYERSRRRREEYRARLELDRLGLITRDDD